MTSLQDIAKTHGVAGVVQIAKNIVEEEKSFRITERFRTTLTGAFSNLMNHPHFQGINTNITNPNPGMFTGTRPNYEPEKQSYRQVDIKLRIQF